MIHINKIIEEKDKVIQDIKKRNFDYTTDINLIYDKEINRRNLQIEIDNLRFQFNTLNKNKGNREECVKIKNLIKEKDILLTNLKDEIFDILVKIPNVPHHTVPNGVGYDDNKIILQKDFTHKTVEYPLAHWDLATKYNIIDFELGNKITGKGFPVYINKGAKLQRAIINFCLDEAGKYGFIEHQVPILVNRETVYGTGQYPDKEEQMYHIEKDNLYLIPTAEVPLTNIYRDVTIDIDKMPVLMTGYTPCFRREAGAYGKDTRGLNRIHQFDKIELVCLTTQEDGYSRLQDMLKYIQGLLEKLELTYRVVEICGGDIGFGAAKAYDLECWCPVQEKWLEVVTVTNFDTFQANRLNCKCKYKDGTKKLVHTLNGTGLALPRIIATILETYQTENGIDIPEILKGYTNFDNI
jgi:seryl-tRNA synthetase